MPPPVAKSKITHHKPEITEQHSPAASREQDADYDPIFDEVLQEIVEDKRSRNTRVEIDQQGERHTQVEGGNPQAMGELFDQAIEHQPSQDFPTVEGFRIVRQIGSGGMGTVFLAQRIKDNKRVAIKFLKSKTAVSPHNQAAFMREVAITSKIKHKHIIKCYETGCIGDQFYFVMQYCKGGSISRVLRNTDASPEPKRVAKFLSRILKGLAFAHSHGLVHRDIKPANILLAKVDGKWVPKIADFGLAKDFEKAGFSGMTATGVYGGSFPYMPREQLTNYKYVNPASDIFSLGVTFYRLITGEYPRPSDKNADPIGAILNGRIVPLDQRLPDYHPGITQIINTAILDDCTKRYENGKAMQIALKAVMDKEGWR
ncbi:MAG: serine/threonine-protein kinase [Pirellulales bacterium]